MRESQRFHGLFWRQPLGIAASSTVSFSKMFLRTELNVRLLSLSSGRKTSSGLPEMAMRVIHGSQPPKRPRNVVNKQLCSCKIDFGHSRR